MIIKQHIFQLYFTNVSQREPCSIALLNKVENPSKVCAVLFAGERRTV